jgi:DNA adenine methylase
MSINRPFLNYFGGKWNLGVWIIDHLPHHGAYIEVFGGGLSVFMQKPKAQLEIVNDLDGRIVNAYRQARDNHTELKRLIELTPYARSEFRICQESSSDPLEDARRTICALAFGVGHSLSDKTTGLRNSKKSNTAPSRAFRNYAETFEQFHWRLKHAIIENLDWREMLKKYDDKDSLFYLDPHYVHSTRKHKRGYNFEMQDLEHEELITAIQSLKGKVVLSGYRSKIYSKLPWETVEVEARTQNAGSATEVLWLCPKTAKEQKQMDLIL